MSKLETFLGKCLLVIVVLVATNSVYAEEEEKSGQAGTINLPNERLAELNIPVDTVSQKELQIVVTLNGRLSSITDRVAHLAPRFPGIIKEVRKQLGDTVQIGDVLAIIESNQSLQHYEVKALRPGTVLERHATLGEFASESSELFVIGDLSTLWVNLTVFQQQANSIELGQSVTIRLGQDVPEIRSIVSFISPLVDELTQSQVVRAVIPNPNGSLAPGKFCTGEIQTSVFTVPLAVRSSAVQKIGGKDVVFVQDGTKSLHSKEVAIGRSDHHYTEILSGLTLEERYAADNTFLLKAELGKGEAEED